jgi:hypothetical protein
MEFDLDHFRKGRHIKRLIGLIGFWGGLAFMFCDMFTNFPTPERGIYTTYWLVVIAIGGGFWLSSRKYPLSEALIIGNEKKGFLTTLDVVQGLGVTPNTAEAILQELEKQGYARIRKLGDDEFVYHVSKSKMFNEPDIIDALPVGLGPGQEEFIAPVVEELRQIKALREHLEKDSFYQDVGSICEIMESYIKAYLSSEWSIDNFIGFPNHVKKLREMLEKYIQLFPHKADIEVKSALSKIQETFANSITKFRKMLLNLLRKDIEEAEIEARVLDRLLDLDI